MIKLIIVDDHLLFLEGLKQVLSPYKDLTILAQFNNGLELQEYCSKCTNKPDIILMNVQMPIVNGIEATEWLRIHQPNIKVIALTMHDNIDIIIKMINAGAKSYVLKTVNSKELYKSIIETYQKGYYYTKEVKELGLDINN